MISVCPNCGSLRTQSESESGIHICSHCNYSWSQTEKRFNHPLIYILVILFLPVSLTYWFCSSYKHKSGLVLRLVLTFCIWGILVFCILKSWSNCYYHENSNQYTTEQLAHFMTPDEEHIKNALMTVPGVVACASATTSNDPNHGLSKEHGYISDTFFSYDKLSNETVPDVILSNGTDHGGSIEVYSSVSDTKPRLRKLFFTSFSAGGCYRIGTVIIRVSRNLSDSEQRELISQIVSALAE